MHIYLSKMIGDSLFRLLWSKKIDEDEKQRLIKYYKEIMEIFNTHNPEIAEELLNKLLSQYNDISRYLQRFIKRKIIPDFKRLTQFMHNPNIPRTTNQVENYFRQTLPKAIKKKFKSMINQSFII